MSSSIRCPGCGLVQSSRQACQACGGPLPPSAEPLLRTAPAVVPGAAVPSAESWPVARPPADGLDPAFDRDRFLLRQRALTVNQKYEVWDEAGRPILFVERPAHVLRNLGALLAGLAAGAAVGALLWVIGSALDGKVPPGVLAVYSTLAVVAALAAVVLVGAALARKRHVTFYRDESRRERLLEIEQDHKLFLVRHTYTVRDPEGRPLAVLGKNLFTDILRKRWTCDAAGGQRLCVAKEAIGHAIVSRLLGKLFPMNFVFHLPDGAVAGQFNRRFTLLERYVLDLSADGARRLDRRLALALGIMLDTGERR
jgi:uncharacterized protein YxjI